MDFENKIRNLIKYYQVSLAEVDKGDYPTTQAIYLDDTTNVEVLYPYGSHGNPPNESIGLGFNVMGYAESNVGIFYNNELRPKGLAPGEYACGNFSLSPKSIMTYLNDGSISVVSNSGASVILDDSGDIIATSSSGHVITLVGDVATVVAPDIQLTGAVNITGTLTVSGAAILSSTLAVLGTASLGAGGAAIARSGDPVEVEVTSGSSIGTYSGTITAGSPNNTAN